MEHDRHSIGLALKGCSCKSWGRGQIGQSLVQGQPRQGVQGRHMVWSGGRTVGVRAPVASALHYGLLHTVHILVRVNELQNTALQALLAAHCAEVEVLQDKLQIINQHGPDQPLGRCMGGGGGGERVLSNVCGRM